MTHIVGNRTLRDLLDYRARTTPERAFVIFDDLKGNMTQLSYAEFDAQVNRAANLLHTLGIGHGNKLNLHLPNCLEFLFLWFGAAKIGAVIMPTNVASPAAELEYLVDHSESRLIFTTHEHLNVITEVRSRCPRIEAVLVCDGAIEAGYDDFRQLMEKQNTTAPEVEVKPVDDAAILYTSGTTARPKGVMVTHANYIYAGETVAKAIRLSPDDRHYVVMPLFHGNAQYYSTMSALVTGASLALMARFSASRYFDRCIAHECTVASLFAAPIRMLLAQERKPEHRDNRLRVVIFAQNVTEAQLAQWRERFGAPLLQLWGMTETMGPPLMNPVEFERRNMSMGLPVMGYEVALVDDTDKAVAPGEIGQVVVRGEPGWTLMKGYFKNPEATAETLREGWLWSGDNARQDEDGYFHFVDRAKDMIKRSGENVAASEVETVVLQHPKVFDCAVIGAPDEMRDERIKAFVVVREGERVDAAEIISWCRERLATFRVPELVEFRRELPRTSVGKIQKHVLRRESVAQTAKQYK
ncbi:MAG: class I adenylate-forming enzyme family protein [Acidiferrobacterales bacterium]